MPSLIRLVKKYFRNMKNNLLTCSIVSLWLLIYIYAIGNFSRERNFITIYHSTLRVVISKYLIKLS